MSIQYELWLTDDTGQRLTLLKNIAFLTYTRGTRQFGTVSFGLPFEPFKKEFITWFRPDWRVEVWRSPAYGVSMRREDVYLLRKPSVYTREDNMQMIQFYGRNGWDLLNRRHIIQRAGTSYTTKTDYADDMMKEIVTEQMLYGSAVDQDGASDNTRAWPRNEFSVQGDVSLGPSMTLSCDGKNVLDVLRDISDYTLQAYQDDPDNVLRVFLDVIPLELDPGDNDSSSPLGWQFVTRAGLYGADRTEGIEYSLENENIKAPSYSISHLDEVNTVYVQGNGRGETQIIEAVSDSYRVALSRWNRSESVASATNETSTTGLQHTGKAELEKGKPVEDLKLEFLNTKGGPSTPRSLYGLDWDLGDRLRVNYAGRQFDVEINLVYVSVDDAGNETITGRNEVQNA